MAGRKLSIAVLAGAIAAVVIGSSCRDQALTVAGTVGDASFAANLHLLGGDGQSGGVSTALPESLSVKVVDAGGTPVSGAIVNWTVRLGGGSVLPPTGVSDTAGIVSTQWTLGSAGGENAVRAYLLNGYVVDSVNFTASGGVPLAVIWLNRNSPATATRGRSLAEVRRFEPKSPLQYAQ